MPTSLGELGPGLCSSASQSSCPVRTQNVTRVERKETFSSVPEQDKSSSPKKTIMAVRETGLPGNKVGLGPETPRWEPTIARAVR